MRFRDPEGKWKVDARFYFRFMDDRPRKSVPWGDEGQTTREWSSEHRVPFRDEVRVKRWRFTRTRTDRVGKPPRWCAAVSMVHDNPEPSDSEDPWDYSRPELTEM